MSPSKIEFKEKIVTKIQERVISHTKIIESPDGTKVTIIDTDSRKESETVAERSSKPSQKQWQVIATMTQDRLLNPGPVYGIGVTKNIILGLSGGLYGTTDKQYGVVLTYSF